MIRRAVRLLGLCLALLAPLGSGVQAQHTLAVAIGSRIRVQTQDDSTWRVGRLAGTALDTLRLRQCDSCAAVIYSLPSLNAIQVSVGRTRRASTILNGGLLGALVGAGSGALYGWAKTRHCAPEASVCGIEYLAVPFFGVGGLFIGMAVGASFKYDDWRPAPIH